ncbi:hypothetical protein VSX64_16115 [Aurantimonas sp. C2-6-R+9]|uniref:hypothetical protein n=1 Tax=unclassified Aurantimonas TaxID=2638230 RepID=UPI002E17BB10|nr:MULTISPECIES: hypothetical protein [unclassified Aurantimonas]MEC5291910.1 hypothetical protein [Aurantimonas sp. C2-3-R2]MEC5382389.1 hypothetical protein [Aurantimonas sp. C2-6-R+9]MEC5412996.1 hypothetical protein [Aurantimonas sp. C2-4-R8]
MTPLLIVALPTHQQPLVWWASDAYVIAASSRLDDLGALSFEEAWQRYAERHDQAHCFWSQAEARQWAETYDGPHWLEARAEIARAGAEPPHDLVFAE